MNKPEEKPKLEYYTVEVEALVPTVLKYKVEAASAEEAVLKCSTSPLIGTPKPNFGKLRKLHAKVFKFGTHLLKYSKKL